MPSMVEIGRQERTRRAGSRSLALATWFVVRMLLIAGMLGGAGWIVMDQFPGLSNHPVLLVVVGGMAFAPILFLSGSLDGIDQGSWRDTLLFASGIDVLVTCASGAKAAYGYFAAWMYSLAVGLALYVTVRFCFAIVSHRRPKA